MCLITLITETAPHQQWWWGGKQHPKQLQLCQDRLPENCRGSRCIGQQARLGRRVRKTVRWLEINIAHRCGRGESGKQAVTGSLRNSTRQSQRAGGGKSRLGIREHCPRWAPGEASLHVLEVNQTHSCRHKKCTSKYMNISLMSKGGPHHTATSMRRDGLRPRCFSVHPMPVFFLPFHYAFCPTCITFQFQGQQLPRNTREYCTILWLHIPEY